MDEKIDKGGHRKGAPIKRKHAEAIAASNIMTRIRKAAQGEVEMTATQIRAAELYLSKTVPSLSAVEQTIVNDSDAKTIEQINAELIAMVKDNPHLLTMLQSAVGEDTPTRKLKVVSSI